MKENKKNKKKKKKKKRRGEVISDKTALRDGCHGSKRVAHAGKKANRRE